MNNHFNHFSLSFLPCGNKSSLLHTTQTQKKKLISSLGPSMSHLTIAYQEHPFRVGSPFFDQILWMRTEVQSCFCQKWLVAFGCWIIHALCLFYSESWGRWQPVGSQQVLAADVHSQKLCRYPSPWMVFSLWVKVKGRGIAFACTSWEPVGWRQEHLDGSCRWHF